MLRLLILSILFLSAAPAFASTVTFDAAFEKGFSNVLQPTVSESFVSTSGTNCTPSPCATGGTIAANSNRALLIVVSFRATTASIPTAVGATWNGVTATPINSYTVAVTGGKTNSIWWFVLVNPTAGAQTLATSWTAAGSLDSVALGAISYYNVNQLTPTQNFTTNSDVTATSTAPTLTVTSASGNMAAVAFSDDNASGFTANAGTLDWKELALSGNFESVHRASTTASTVVSGTLGSAKDWLAAGFDVVADTGTGGGGTGNIYYVATTGSDGNPGTQASPWRNPQKCAQSPVVAGDTCLVGDGIYGDPNTADSTYNVIQINSSSPWSSPNGTAAQPITIKSLNPLGAKLLMPVHFSNSAGDGSVEVVKIQNRNYYIIDGFEIYQDSGVNNGTGNSNKGIYINSGTGHVIRNNTIHDIARLICSTSVLGNAGIFIGGGTPASITVTNNLMYSVGRLRVGESGCAASVTNDANDHGIYIHEGSTLAIMRNVIYDTNRGWPIQFNSPTATISNVTVANNTLADKTTTIKPVGQLELYGNLTNFTIKNNIFSGPLTWAIDYGSTTNFSNILIDHNLTSISSISNGTVTGVTLSNNLTSTTPGFTNAGTRDYSLTSASAAIGAGTTATGVLCNATCDIGAFETFGFTSAGITAATLDVLLGMSLNTPVLPATVQTIWTVGCTGSNCGTPVVASAAKLTGTDSIVRLTLTGLGGSAVCEAGQTWTVTYAVGTVTDSALIGTSKVQPMKAFATQAVVNNCAAPATTGTLSQKTHQFTQSQTPGTALGLVGAANTNIRRGTSFALVTQTDCTVHACDAIGEKIYYRITPIATGVPSAYAAVPDVMGTDQIAYLGNTSDPSYLSGPISCCLTGALTANDGSTQFTAAAIPVFTLAQDASIVQRRQLRIGTNALLNDIYEFLEYNQTGVVLSGGSTPAGGAKITVTPAATITAPTNLTAVGASSNTIIEMVWAPVTDTAIGGYQVYGCTTTPCTISNGTLLQTITAASAAAAHTTMTTFRTVVAQAGTYYFVVYAFDSGGQQSAASNEITVVRTGFTAPAVRVP